MSSVSPLPYSSVQSKVNSSQSGASAPNISNLVAPSAITRRRAASFLRRGKRETREGHLRALWLTSSKQFPDPKLDLDAFFSALRSGTSPKLSVQLPSVSLTPVDRSASLRSFALSTTPFVSLRTRRQSRSASKRPVVKIGHLSSRLGLRKALVSLTNSLQTSGAASQPFVVRLRRQLEPFNSSGTGAVPSRQESRDNIHRQAFQALPSTWSSPSRSSFFRSK